MTYFDANAEWAESDPVDVESIGVNWREPIEFISDPLELLHAWLRVVIGGLILIACANSPEAPTLLAIAAGLGVLWVAVYYFGYLICTRKRSLLFHSSNAITMPQGQPGWFKGNTVKGHVSKIISIENQAYKADNGHNKYRVNLYFNNGSIACVSTGLCDLDAHALTVQLNDALMELRESMGRMARHAAAAYSVGELID